MTPQPARYHNYENMPPNLIAAPTCASPAGGYIRKYTPGARTQPLMPSTQQQQPPPVQQQQRYFNAYGHQQPNTSRGLSRVQSAHGYGDLPPSLRHTSTLHDQSVSC